MNKSKLTDDELDLINGDNFGVVHPVASGFAVMFGIDSYGSGIADDTEIEVFDTHQKAQAFCADIWPPKKTLGKQ